MSFAMGLNSLHTKRALIGKSKTGFIKVNFAVKFGKNENRFLVHRLFVILIIIQVAEFSYGLIMKKPLLLIKK